MYYNENILIIYQNTCKNIIFYSIIYFYKDFLILFKKMNFIIKFYFKRLISY